MSQWKKVALPGNFITPSAIFAEQPKPFEDQYARQCFRVLRMTAILHGKGFHGLRVLPYLYPIAYRIELFPASFSDHDGVKYRFGAELEEKQLIARHTGAMGARFFGWEDTAELSAHALAILFVERYPELARAVYHLDFAYAGWFATLLAHCEYGYLPYLFGEYEEEIGAMRLHYVGQEPPEHQMNSFPLPPNPSGGFSLHPQPSPPWMVRQ